MYLQALTSRSTRTPPALSSALSLLPASSASFSASVQAVPVSFGVRLHMLPSEELIGIAKEWSELDSLNSFEVLPFADKALRLISDHPTRQSDFVLAFERILTSPGFDLDLVAVCAHVLRWPELRSRIEFLHQRAVESNNLRAEPVFRDILQAFNPDWLGQDRDLYYPDFFAKWLAT